MKSMTKLAVTGMMTAMVVMCCSIGNAQTTVPGYSNYLTGTTLIYSNGFGGSSTVNITNTEADQEYAIYGGVANTNWTDLRGPTDNGQFFANGTVSCTLADVIVLPFTPQSNHVYSLQTRVSLTGNPGTWVASGFEAYNQINTAHYEFNGNGGWNWALLNANGSVQYFAGQSGGGGIYGGTPIGTAVGALNTFTYILDTTFDQNPSNCWTITAFYDGIELGAPKTYPSNPLTPNPIAAVGYGQYVTESAPQNIQWNYFMLTASQLAVVGDPVSMSANQGAGAGFKVVAGGTPPFSYQWYTNGVAIANGGAISGATNATLSISSVLPENASTNYYCVVTNVYGAVTSTPASLVVYSTPQFLAADPVTLTNVMTLFGGTNSAGTNYLGASPTFSVNVGGLQPMSYFWLTNGVAVGGANSNTFTFANCQLDSPTNFTCIASNSLGTATNVWLAQYIPTPTAAYPQMVLADNPVAYWRLDETNSDPNQYNNGQICDDFMSGNNGVYTNTALFQPGYYVITNGVPTTNDPTETSAQFGPFDSTTGCDANSIGTNVDFSAFTNAEFSVSIWANGGYGYNGTEPVNGGILVKGYYGFEEYGLDCGGGGGTARFFIRTAGNAVVSASSTFQLGGNNTWHHLVGVCDESNGVINLFIDGLLTAQTAVAKGAGVLPIAASSPITIGASTTASTLTGDHQFDGALDDAAVFNQPLSSSQVLQLYQAAGGQISLNLVAPLPPTNAVWRQNSTLTIPAFAVGAPPLGYYWTNVTAGGILGGANIKGGSGVSAISTLTATLTITNAPPSYSGDQLELVVTNASGSTNWFTTLFSYPPPITISYTNSILYSNVFDGGTWNLAGTATTLANSLVGGTNSTWTDALGTNDSGSMEGSGLDNSTLGDSWVLPFTPESGYVYTIDASAYMTGYPGSWIGTGFSGPVPHNAPLPSARFADASIFGYDFIIWVQNTGNVQFFQGPGAAVYLTNVNNFISTALPMTHTAQVVLDTTAPQWVEYAFMDGIPAGTNTFPSNPPIGSVGLTQSGLGAPNTVQWTSFALTAVAPGGIPPYLLAPLPSTKTITLPNPTSTYNVTAFGSAPMGYYWINNSTILGSGVTNTPNPGTPNNAAPIPANITIPTNTLAAGSLELVVTNAYGTNITTIPLVSPPPSIAQITWGVTNGNLYLSWPSANIGAQLQAQTNTVGTGLSTNWVDVSGSPTTNMVVFPVNPANGTVFYRLHP
ncbi:MAG TPA: immunoglobulin domain-containing protein [Verrucomicrobiae bacterium]|nr:immunoglobulin domain-containing protein [Verrucomicrobiae bacterium]